jgi:hypothetical protein
MGRTGKLLFKLSVYCIVATGIGYSIMYLTTPSREQMLREFSEERREKVLKDPQFKQDMWTTTTLLSEHLKKNIQSDQPIWKVNTLSQQEAEELSKKSV